MRDLVQASSILSVIGNGANKMSEIAARVNKEASSLTGPVRKLLSMNLICREVPFGDNPKDSKKSMYHLSVLFLKEKPTKPSSCLTLFPEDVIL